MIYSDLDIFNIFKVSGLKDGQQVLTALWSYQHNLGLMGSAIDYMTELFSHHEEQYSQLYPGAYIEVSSKVYLDKTS